MAYVVVRRFMDVNQAMRLPGEPIDVEPARAQALLRARMIGYRPEVATDKKEHKKAVEIHPKEKSVSKKRHERR